MLYKTTDRHTMDNGVLRVLKDGFRISQKKEIVFLHLEKHLKWDGSFRAL